MILQYGYRSVVVATDTDAALDAFSDELKRLAPAVKVYARHDARVDPKIYKKVKRMEKLFVTEDNGRAPPVVEPWAEYYGFAVDLLALADCDGFLGKVHVEPRAGGVRAHGPPAELFIALRFLGLALLLRGPGLQPRLAQGPDAHGERGAHGRLQLRLRGLPAGAAPAAAPLILSYQPACRLRGNTRGNINLFGNAAPRRSWWLGGLALSKSKAN